MARSISLSSKLIMNANSYRDVNRIGLDSVITATLASCPVLVQTLQKVFPSLQSPSGMSRCAILFFYIPPYLLNTSLVASQRRRPSLLHHCSHSLCGKEF